MEADFLIDMFENGGVNDGEHLQALHASEARHGPLPPSKEYMRILDLAVNLLTGLLAVGIAYFLQGRAIRPKPIRHDDIGSAVLAA